MQKKEKSEMNLDTQVLSPRGDLLWETTKQITVGLGVFPNWVSYLQEVISHSDALPNLFMKQVGFRLCNVASANILALLSQWKMVFMVSP